MTKNHAFTISAFFLHTVHYIEVKWNNLHGLLKVEIIKGVTNGPSIFTYEVKYKKN